MNDDRHYWVYSPDRIRLSPTAKSWAREHGMTLQEFARYLIARHLESDSPFAHDTGGHAAARDSIRGFEPEPLTGFEGDANGIPAGRGDIEGFAPQVLEETAAELRDAFAGDAAQHPPGRNQIEGFQPEPERQRINGAEAYWGTKW
jgi:hypothetical protein